MFAPTNPERERIRAQAILRSLTEYREAVEVFAAKSQDEPGEIADHASRNYGQSIMRAFKSIRLNRRPVVDEPVQRPAHLPQKVTSSGC